MALDFFRIERGLELDDLVQYLQGTGNPGTGGDTAAALVGSVYTDNSDGALWTKITAGTGTDKWRKQATQEYVDNATGASISWREPVRVRENVATVLPTGTPGNPITVDGVSITNNQRVLFSNITGNKNIFIYDQAAGTFTEDANAETSGDATYVQAGTDAGSTYVYNGTNWVLTNQSSADEDGYIRAFIGKDTVGNEMPNYTSNNFVVDGTSLEAAIGVVDLEIGPNVTTANFITSANKINQNIQALDTEIGANVSDGNYILAASKINGNIQSLDTHLGPNFAAGNYITLNQTVFGAVTALDVAIGPNVSTGNFILSTNKVQANIQALDTEIGANVTNGTYILAANSMNTNIQALDAAIGETSLETSATNVTSITTIDSVTAGAAKWFVRCELVSDTTRVYAVEVYALNDGGTGSDYTRYAALRLGTAIPGISVTVDSVSAGILRLRVAASSAVNVDARRASVII